MIDYIDKLKWCSYNCFSSAIGALLSYHEFPYISSVIDAGWDFYHDPTATFYNDIAGVWPGPEHNRVYQRTKEFYNVKIKPKSHDKWEEILPILENTVDGKITLIAINNLSLDYIPGQNIVGSLTHYLLLYNYQNSSISFYDSFLSKAGKLEVANLKESMNFTTSGGHSIKYKIYNLEYDKTISYKDCICKDSLLRFLSNSLINPSIETLLGNKKNMKFGPQAIQSLSSEIVEYKGDEGLVKLGILSQRFKDVHYQRVFFIRFLEELSEQFDWIKILIDQMLPLINEIVNNWFNIKTFALYTTVRKKESLITALGNNLKHVADKEEIALEKLYNLSTII